MRTRVVLWGMGGSAGFRPILVLLVTATASVTAGAFFGFTDSTGEHLLVFEPEETALPPGLVAVLPDGGTVTLEYLGHREEKDASTHRQTVHNFDNLPGHLFGLPAGAVEPGATVLLADEAFLGERTPLEVTAGALEPLEPPLTGLLEAAKGGRAVGSWDLALLGDGIRLVLVQFEPSDSSSLACLVMVDGESLVFEDYVGAPMNDCSVWRADDGGVFYPQGFSIIAAFDTPSGTELVRTWAGPEGESSALIVEDGDRFREILSGYRYQAPL